MVTLHIPLIPHAKARPRVVNGRAYTPAATTAYERSIKLAAAHLSPLSGPLSVSVVFIFPRLKSSRSAAREVKATRPDLDNLLKAVLDGLNGVAFHDDGQVVQVSGEKWIAAADEEAHLEITIEPYSASTEPPHRREKVERREVNRAEHRRAQAERAATIAAERKGERREKLAEVEQHRADQRKAKQAAAMEALREWTARRRS